MDKDTTDKDGARALQQRLAAARQKITAAGNQVQDAAVTGAVDSDATARMKARLEKARGKLAGGEAPAVQPVARIAETAVEPESSLPDATQVRQGTPEELLKSRLALARHRVGGAASSSAVQRTRRGRLSSIQKRLWFLEQFDAASAAYNMYVVREVVGHFDVAALSAALDALLLRHQVLRTCFVFSAEHGEPLGQVREAAQLPIRTAAYPDASDAKHPDLTRAIAAEIAVPFNLADNLPIRCSLFDVGSDRQVLLLVLHHIAGDAYSMGLLSRELFSDYTEFAAGRPSQQKPPAIQYSDFAEWQYNWLNDGREALQIEYWRKQLSGAPEIVCLPTDRPRAAIQTSNGALYRFRVEGELLDKVRVAAGQAGGTVFMFMLSAYFLLFQRYSQETDLVVGIPVSGRSRTEFESVIGAFLNTLALRVQAHPGMRVRELMGKVRACLLDAFDHQDVPLERLIEVLNPKRSLSHSPIFQLMFNYIHADPRVQEINGMQVVPYAFEQPRAKTDLSLELTENPQAIIGRVIYNTDLFDHQSMERFGAHFLNVLTSMVDSLDQTISDVDFITPAEYDFFRANGFAQAVRDDAAECMHSLFEKQVRAQPDAIALCGGGSSLSYRELDERANRLAHFIVDAGLAIEEPVGIFMERNIDVVVSMLAVLKAGGAYVPIDITNPPERVASIIGEAGIRFVLTHSEQAVGLEAPSGVQVIRLDGDAAALHRMSSKPLAGRATAGNLMYVLFTSGSTGRPKGVAIEHRHYYRFFTSIAGKMALQRGEHFAIVSTFAADLGTPMIWGALGTGGCLHVLSYEESIDPAAFRNYLREHPVDVIKIVPSHFNALAAQSGVDGLLPRRLLVFGGESSYWGTFRKIWAQAPELEIQISYGPTETTVTASAYTAHDDVRRADDEPVAIGQPLPHARAYVLDNEGRVRPRGLPGLLHIGGGAVARGYLHQPVLTTERFVDNHFCPDTGERLYATGDMVRFGNDEQLHFLGRMDDQVKVRGYRIELGEIRSAIIESPQVRDAAVVVYEDASGQRELGAYLVLAAGSPENFDPAPLRDFLRDRLPGYMLPRRYLPIAAIPLNANGKIDRRALPDISAAAAVAGNTHAAASTPSELRLLAIWQDVLGQAELGIDDNFFDLGGDSFKAIRVARAADARMSVIDVFKFPTIRDLAQRIDTKGDDEKYLLVELTAPSSVPPAERINLVCVPYGGGNPVTFQPLANALPANYSLFAVELPGHDFSRPAESFQSLETVAQECLAEIRDKVAGRIVVYGHCLGGALAIELGRLLEEQGLPLIGVAMGGNFPAPRLTGGFFRMWETLFPRERMISDRNIIDMLRLWGGFLEVLSLEEQKFMVHALRHDRMEAERYYTEVYARGEMSRLSVPLVCVCGDADRTTEFFEERYRDWAFFSPAVSLETIERAGHYFHKHQAEVLAGLIDKHVGEWNSAAAAPAELVPDAVVPAVAAPGSRRKEAAGQLSRMWRNRQIAPSMTLFMLVAVGQLLSTLGAGITGFALGVWVYETTRVATDFAVISILTLAPGMLVLPFAGAIADRYDRRLILLASNIVAALSSLLVAGVLWFSELSVIAVYVAAFISSIAGALQRPAYLASIAQITPKRYLGQANGLAQMVTASGLMLAPMMGGLLFKMLGLEGILVIHLVCFVIAFVIMVAIRFPNALFRRREEPVLKEIAGGFRYLTRRRSLMVMIGFFLVFNLVWGVPTVLVTPLVLSLDSPSALGMIVAAMSAGTIVGGAVMGMWGGTARRAHGMVGFVVLGGLSFVVLGASANLVTVAIGAFLSRLALSLINTHWQAIIQSKVGLELQGRVFAINFLLANLLLPLGSYIAGYLSDRALPGLQDHGFVASMLQVFSGFGSAQGMALLIFASGVFMMIWGVAGLLYKPLRLMEDHLPDAIPDAEIIDDKDKLQALADLRATLDRERGAAGVSGEAGEDALARVRQG